MERQIGDEHMLYDFLGRVVHVLNETAYFIWQRCDGQHTIKEMIEEASSLCKAPEEEVRTDIEDCVSTFHEKRGLIKDYNQEQ
jgi:hypothetical protein